MDKGYNSIAGLGESTSSSSSSSSQYLKQLNKLSHKIAKPSSSATTNNNAFDQHQNQPPPPQQPAVYNINKNDFRDVVQKLTGSSSQPQPDRCFSTPPPIQPPKPPSSRLQRIRPQPLPHISNRPPSMLSSAPPPAPIPPPHPNPPSSNTTVGTSNFIHAHAAPLSPLSSFPGMHAAAAESPVSAYMKYLQNLMSSADPNSKTPQFSGFSPLAPLLSPRWNTDTSQQQGVAPPSSQQQQMSESQQSSQQQQMSESQQWQWPSQFPFPSSPLPFGFLNSPRSPYPLLSPSLLFSPTSGQLNFPLSPRLPVPSPRWRGP